METRMSIPHYRQQTSFNLIALLVVIGVNVMANTATLNGRTTGEISKQYPNLFTPADITFSIWSIIYLGLLGFAGYQLWLSFTKGHEAELSAFIVRMKYWFLLNCLGNACWLFAWHYDQIWLSLLFMFMILFTLGKIHSNFRIAHPGAPLREKIFIHFPFGIYLGWISIATIANIFAFLVSVGWTGWGLSQVTWAVTGMIIGTLAALFMIFRHNNTSYVLVCIWAFYGIILKQEATLTRDSPPIIAAGTVIIAVLALSVLMQLLRKRPLL
ncbi:tryptophan-rich sensory protein [Chitinophaga barathri]|uniref:Tryptophan-rich sensory protein n=1 Tax=Chitinophaga barathri TaxID=1647451 RepID=A0A3N4MWB5_9BACT|nr:tryptophan-rich sensory protein [Chitinophaga barathri]RPD39683.1 tryptophan-rich sensory protein [Chitinophaga barathri]